MTSRETEAKPRPAQDSGGTVKQVHDQQHTGNHDQPQKGGSDRLGGTRAGAENVESKER